VENIETSAEHNVVEVGDDLTMTCNPNNANLNVWWTAEHTTGEIMQIVSGQNRVVVTVANTFHYFKPFQP